MSIAMRPRKNSFRQVLVGLLLFEVIAITCVSSADEPVNQAEDQAFEGKTGEEIQKEIDRRSIILRPSDADANEIALNVHFDNATWEAYRRATLQVVKSDKNLVLFETFGKLADAEIKPPVIKGCEKLFRDPQFKSGLPPDFPPKKYAQWFVAMYYYQMLDSVAGRILNPSLGKPGVNPHDQNYYFFYTHRAEIEKFWREVRNIMGVENVSEN